MLGKKIAITSSPFSIIVMLSAYLSGNVIFGKDQKHWPGTGQFVRFDPNRISLNNASALESVYGVQAITQNRNFTGFLAHFFRSRA